MPRKPTEGNELPSAEQCALDNLLWPYRNVEGSPWASAVLVHDVVVGNCHHLLETLPSLLEAPVNGAYCEKLRVAAELPAQRLADLLGLPMGRYLAWERGESHLVPEILSGGFGTVEGIRRLFGCIALWLGDG